MSSHDPDFVRRLVGRALRLTIVVEFLVNLYVFPLVAELFLTPIVLFFVMLQAYAQYEPTEPTVRRFIEGALFGIGLALLIYVGVRVVANPEGFGTRENAERFLVAPVLTLALLPFLFAVAWYSRRELAAVRRQFGLEG